MPKPYGCGLVFGTFDMFHIGHLRLLERAQAQCRTLVVGVTTDSYVKAVKGRYPIVPYLERAKIVQAIKRVDLVVPLAAVYDKQSIVTELGIDAIFSGDDWTPATSTSEGLGVPVIYLPRTPGVSSSDRRRILQSAYADHDLRPNPRQ